MNRDSPEVNLGLQIENGHVRNAVVYSDAMNSALIGEIASALKGMRFKAQGISRRLQIIDPPECHRMIIHDPDAWLSSIFENKADAEQ